MATIAEIKQALVNAHKAGDTEGAAKIAEILKQQMAVTPRSQAEVDKEYNAMPWYKQAATAADDLVRIGASGITFGGIDRLLGPEAEKATQEARMRAGWAGVPAEVMGTLASPVTRAVGAVGSAATRAVPGLLSRIGISAAEGGTLGATDAAIKGKDIQEGATTGALIGGAVPAVAKAISGTSSFLQGTKQGAIDEAFNAGKKGGTISRSFRDGQAGRPINAAKNEFDAAESAWDKGAVVDWTKLQGEFNKIKSQVYTKSGAPKMTPEDVTAFKQIGSAIRGSLKRGSNVENMDAIRRQLDAWSGDGATEMQKMMATRLKDAIRKSVEKVQPGYTKDLNKYSDSKTAQAAGQELANIFPKGSLLGHLAQGIGFGSAAIGSSILSPSMAAALPLFSPKTMGILANLSGQLVGKTGATAGAAAPMWSNYQDSRKRKKEQRKRLEISIPGGDLPVGQ